MSKESKLEKLKKDYAVLQKKHRLPNFESLNQDFHIERVASVETDILIREIRKLIGEKLVNYIRFVENLINPINVPMFIFSVVKILDSEDKKKLSEIYKLLVEKELQFIETDLEFFEKREAEFINDSYSLWQNIKKDLISILDKVKDKSEKNSGINSKSYFG